MFLETSHLVSKAHPFLLRGKLQARIQLLSFAFATHIFDRQNQLEHINLFTVYFS